MKTATITLRHKKKNRTIVVSQDEWAQDLGRGKFKDYERVSTQHNDDESATLNVKTSDELITDIKDATDTLDNTDVPKRTEEEQKLIDEANGLSETPQNDLIALGKTDEGLEYILSEEEILSGAISDSVIKQLIYLMENMDADKEIIIFNNVSLTRIQAAEVLSKATARVKEENDTDNNIPEKDVHTLMGEGEEKASEKQPATSKPAGKKKAKKKTTKKS